MALRALLFTYSLIATISTYGQGKSIRVNWLGLGIDPVRSVSMLFPEHNAFSHQFYYNTWQVNSELAFSELLLPVRTSIVASYGYTKAHLQEFEGTLDYHSHGTYAKFGLNFNLSELTDRSQGLIGWRIGVSRNYWEDATIVLEGEAWGNTVRQDLGERTQSIFWGEIILEEKYRLSTKKTSALSNLWFSVQGSLRFNNKIPDVGQYISYNIPGFGRYNILSPGFSFNLAYYLHFKHKVVYPETPKHKNMMHKRKYGRVLDYHYQ